jgi:hypothetical protein
MSALRFYRWNKVLADYTFGGMCAVAGSIDEARAAIRKECHYVPESDLAQQPEIIELEALPAMVVWGGS